MTPQQVIDQARYLTRTSSSDGAANDTDMLRVLNDYYYRLVTLLVSLNEDKFGRKAFTNLNVNPNQEYYRLPPDCMKVKRVEVSYDGTNWYKMRAQDSGEVRDYALDRTDVTNQYLQSEPYYDVFGDSLYLRPIPTEFMEKGLKLWYIRLPSELSSLSGVFSAEVPDEFVGYLPYGVAGEIATRKVDESLASMMFQKWENGRQKIKEEFPPLDLNQNIDFIPPTVNYA